MNDESAHPAFLGRRPGSAQPTLRLVCFPGAGGSATLFRDWQGGLPETIEVTAYEPPGRGWRFGEPPLEDMDALVADVLGALDSLPDLPLVLLGHSLGGVVAWEVARALHQTKELPELLVLCASKAPGTTQRIPPFGHKDDDGFVAGMTKLGGTPPELIGSSRSRDLLMPIWRADFKLADTYFAKTYLEPVLESLPCPLLVLGGTEDEVVTRRELEPWLERTTRGGRLVMVEGDHYFIRSHPERLWTILREQLESSAARLQM